MTDKTPKGINAEHKQRSKQRRGKPRAQRGQVMPPVYLEPWERQPRESESRYAAFLVYRDQPAQGQLRRSLERAAHAVGKAPKTLELWSREDGWRDRAAAWDRHLQSVQDAATVRKLEELGVRQAQQLAAANQLLMAPVVALLTRIQEHQRRNEDVFADMKLNDLSLIALRAARYMPHVIGGERLVHGLSTANVDAHVKDSRKEARQHAEAMTPVERERFLVSEGIEDGRAIERAGAARRAAAR